MDINISGISLEAMIEQGRKAGAEKLLKEEAAAREREREQEQERLSTWEGLEDFLMSTFSALYAAGARLAPGALDGRAALVNNLEILVPGCAPIQMQIRRIGYGSHAKWEWSCERVLVGKYIVDTVYSEDAPDHMGHYAPAVEYSYDDAAILKPSEIYEAVYLAHSAKQRLSAVEAEAEAKYEEEDLKGRARAAAKQLKAESKIITCSLAERNLLSALREFMEEAEQGY